MHRGLGDGPDVGSLARHAVHPRGEHRHGEVVLLGLHVLRQAQHHRPGVGRVGEHAGHLRQRRQQLLRPGDPVEVARDRPERVVHARGRVAEVLHLLQHRVGAPAGERVAGQQQHRQPVGVGQTGRGHHVERPRTGRGRRRHHLPAVHRPREADRGQRHALLVLTAPGRQLVLDVVQRGAEPEHVAVPEDRENPCEQRHLGAVQQLGTLRDHPLHQRLRRRQPHGPRRLGGAGRCRGAGPGVRCTGGAAGPGLGEGHRPPPAEPVLARIAAAASTARATSPSGRVEQRSGR